MAHILWERQAWNEQRAEMRQELRRLAVKEEDLPKITREQGIIFEDMELVKLRKDNVNKEWGYEEHPLPFWSAAGEEEDA